MTTFHAAQRTHRNAWMAKQGLAAAVALTLCAGIANAKDLYVATTGSDAVSYANNSLSTPWKTFTHGAYNLKAGDHLWIRGGTYAPTYPLWLADDYTNKANGGDPNETMNSQSGTASAPVIIENYNGETPIIDVANVSQGTFINLDNKSYWTFRGLKLINTQQAFLVGEDRPSTNNTFENLTITANRGGDNQGGIAVYNGNGEYTTIRNNVITGPGTGSSFHQNTNCIYIRKINHAKILNNTLSNAPIGVLFKHRNMGTTQAEVDIEFAYNYITNTSYSAFEYNGNFTYIHDNIFGANNANIHFAEANGGAGGDYNVIEHNTFVSNKLVLDSSPESTDPWPGAIGNTFKNNIFVNKLEIHLYKSYTDSTIWGANMFPSSSSITTYGGTITVPSGSVTGTPTFTGGTTPTTIAGFTLASSSIGKSKASDGADLGARIDLFGTPGSTTASPPMAPSGLRVIVE